MTKKDNKIGAEKLEGKINVKIGKYTCRASYNIVGLTESAIKDMNKLIAKEECKKWMKS